jgi:hypothetical protein
MNNNARDCAVVIQGAAPYFNSLIQKSKRLKTSFGCSALSIKEQARV